MTEANHESKKNMPSSQVLNIYINSGGTKASYDDVIAAVEREKIDQLKVQYKAFKPFVAPIYHICKFLDSIND